MFSSLREPELTSGAFSFRWNPQRRISYELALVLVNPKYIAPLKLTRTWGEGALRARSFSAASPQFSGTWIMFSSMREPELTPGAFGFRWNPQMKNSYKVALVLVNPQYMAPLKLSMNLGEGALRAR